MSARRHGGKPPRVAEAAEEEASSVCVCLAPRGPGAGDAGQRGNLTLALRRSAGFVNLLDGCLRPGFEGTGYFRGGFDPFLGTVSADCGPKPVSASPRTCRLQLEFWVIDREGTRIDGDVVDMAGAGFSDSQALQEALGRLVEASLDELAPVRDLLEKPLEPGQVATLAELLLPVLAGEADPGTALARFDEVADRAVEEWFAAGHPRELENLLMATAALGGAPFEAVHRGACELERCLGTGREPRATPTPGAAEEPASRFAGRATRKDQLAAVRARLVPATARTHYEEVGEETVELESEAWRDSVLRFVWRDPELGGRLLEWLTGHAASPVAVVRSRAAAAVGVLARSSFASIEARVLRGWASSDQVALRRSAAEVVGITLWDGRQAAPSDREPALVEPVVRALVGLAGTPAGGTRASLLGELVEWSTGDEARAVARVGLLPTGLSGLVCHDRLLRRASCRPPPPRCPVSPPGPMPGPGVHAIVRTTPLDRRVRRSRSPSQASLPRKRRARSYAEQRRWSEPFTATSGAARGRTDEASAMWRVDLPGPHRCCAGSDMAQRTPR